MRILDFMFKRKKERKNKKIKLWQVLGLVFMSVFLMASSGIFLWVASLELPSLDNFDARHETQSTKIYDRTGKILLFDLHENIRRTIVPLSEISRNIKNATIAIEDSEFYSHKGIKPTSILRAFFANIKSGSYSQGGSTITQQVVKNTLLSKRKTIKRKIKEWILALKLERKMTKDEILELYLNDTPYGGTIYGIEEAAQYFFGVPAKDLTLAQSAYLASLPQRPTYYSPYGSHRESLEARKNLVLKRMLENNFITKKEYEQAKKEEVEFAEYGDKNIKAPHFVFFIKDYLVKKYGRDTVYESGLKVKTTLDYRLQKKAEKLVKEYALANEKKFKASNSAMVAIDPHTGQILAMVGSRDYFDKKIDGKFNVTTALRQPGSTFKPIVYSLAFEKGYTPNTILFDLPTQFSTACGVNNFTMTNGCYAPKNYDNKFRGPMTMANALAQSINVPAVKTLYLVGLKNALQHAKKLGITSLKRPASFYGFPLVLGGGEVSLLELTNAYTAFANEGVKHPYTGILEVRDASGTILEEFKQKDEDVLSANSANMIANILSDNVARTPAYGSHSPLFFKNRQVAAKTGTTNNFKDVWIVGFTPDIVIGTWSGNNNGKPIENRFAGYVLAPEWRAIMNEALKLVPNRNFKPIQIGSANSTTTQPVLKPILNGQWQVPTQNGMEVHSILHWVNKDDPQGPPPANPANDPQYTHWEYSVLNWIGKNNIQAISTLSNTSNPQTTIPSIRIINPKNNSQVISGIPVNISINYPNNMNIVKVEYYLNSVFIGASTNHPYSISIIPQSVGNQSIKAIAYTKMNGVYADSIVFTVR